VKYLLLVIFSFLLIVFQTMISNLFFLGKLMVEISLIMTVYVGFKMTLMKGGLLSFVLGFFLDFFMGSVTGLLAFSYLTIFLISKFVSMRVYSERVAFIMIFVGLCALLEGIMLMSFYKFALGADKFHHLWDVVFPQSLLEGLLGPWFFTLFSKFEVLSNGGNTLPFERSAIG
jgi:rod shape-determining protein MreD